MSQPTPIETINRPAVERSADARQELIQSCQAMVRSIAWLVSRKLPPHVDMDDLIAYGQIGLAQAARDFDPAKGRNFATYAYHRIRGSVYDGLQQMRWFRFADYHGSKYEQMAGELLNVRLEDGGGDETGWMLDTVSAAAVCYLAGDAIDTRRSDADEEPPEELASRELHERLRALVSELPSDARLLVSHIYYDGMSLSEAAEKLHVSRSWACRLHARTLERLGRAMRIIGAGE